MNKKKTFNRILNDIKNVKIQGARNIARAALKAYSLIPSKSSRNILLNSRPTEPMMQNVLDMAEKQPPKEILNHFDSAQEKINNYVLKIIKNGDTIFTHCHSTNVSKALIYAKRKGKRFEVYNTETRPLMQGRKTAKELKNAGIKITMFVDSALEDALSGEGKLKRVNKVFLGADALLSSGIINKIGSELVARIAKEEKIPFYIIADSWKYSRKRVPIENRSLNEIWDKAPKGIKISNSAFEFVPKKYVKAIISDIGFLRYDVFVKKARKN